ncbi:hypothetical protein [Pedobacter gandavensis]|uniref:hypothetical protein n=1 Tax=Pedobacter gandavensis TaxID=2679963 RepID=UPI002930F501|nr:hypothetical protein [Pedobacter gandavensis]
MKTGLMKTSYTFGLSLITLALFSCNAQKTDNSSQKQDSTMATSSDTTRKAPIVGGDQDEHGCKASAGYTWSVLRKECIRPFELENKMIDLRNKNFPATFLFSSDHKQVEIFALDFKKTIILSTEGTDTYASADKKYTMAKDAQKHWIVTKTEDGKTTTILQQE